VPAPLVALLLALPADQALYVSEAQAHRAAERIRAAGRVGWYCQPCRDRSCREARVDSVRVEPAGYGDGRVLVNGHEADLAYLFLPRDGRWANLAKSMKIPVVDVSRTLPGPSCTPRGQDSPAPPPPRPAPVRPPDPFAGTFTVRSRGGDAFARAVLSHQRETPYFETNVRPSPGLAWSVGKTLAIHRFAPTARAFGFAFQALEIQLVSEQEHDTLALCDSANCLIRGSYTIADCHERAPGIHACTLLRLPEWLDNPWTTPIFDDPE